MAVSPIDHLTTDYQIQHAYWLCMASKLAYSDEPEIAAEIQEWGFDRFRFFRSKHEMPFPIQDTQAFTIASDNMIITAFRGTEPTNIADWLSDANTPAAPGPSGRGMIHVGFDHALTSVYPEVRDCIKEFRTNEQSLWFTGHSLGGALAMLAAARLYFEDASLLSNGVYTFGQPRTCDRTMADAYDEAFKSRHFRFVNNNDIVPQVPPEPVFQHVETERYLDSDGNLREDTSFFGNAMDRFKGAAGDALTLSPDLNNLGPDTLSDHFINNYVTNMEKNVT
ncbi:lipase family protein [Haloactinomyces albus]|uniref:Triacylglycerol lipase n=1 Tax=Haloactinomyces albus TaxID=1352928 RepID=A0AAE3ZGF9_9ACTN|nr:lipase family protein [Haloactinomyces albus]MDR7303600.1 triacylglycerol lipase [Haloactinomyces albus]